MNVRNPAGLIYSVVKTRGNTKGGVISGGAISKGGNYLGTGIGYKQIYRGAQYKRGKRRKSVLYGAFVWARRALKRGTGIGYQN